VLAKIESKKAGYDEAILLDHKNHVCEGTGENVFVIKDGHHPHAAAHREHPRRHQPEVADRDRPRLGLTTVVERDIARAELPLADEIFLTGTAAELVPVREIDDIEIGPPGEITRALQREFDDAPARAHGTATREWLDVVPVRQELPSA